ncbi:uncharacterized protein MICPUCDRAFT_49762 [Micromonas pusilla CCMP1545]|uniref:Predicted protein n=2 Tax=Micromonas pusilla TaxID=38833 RepID=C1N817_MICPC|nr:uncharacterized protein MICPUCDRAFT_49762 [Micromonas pusilla CCMP1545]EEH51812.1 predicted protein [Micromonas pusilla CCMP1545]|mmetsp:Transcript_9162/g.33447  ORF Transcript_9162/g.33447 Transcript_9162/m.33447 type:complete len:258 (+) Transcript_9162:270-1043(+)|eukprot:XP_003064190.1 predicted protein [Micromonas pusilla CCMP1545]
MAMTLDNPSKMDPGKVPALVMRSVENATTALRDGDADRAIKMMLSTDELCHKVIAPPTIHGLAMRVLSDAYLAKDNMEDAKKALEKGLSLCKPHDGRANMPPFMKADLNGRMGDLLVALGEVENAMGDHKKAVQHMRQGAERFEVLGQQEFVAATHNRIALTLLQAGKHELALAAVLDAEKLAGELGEGNEHEANILSTTFCYKGRCSVMAGNIDGAREAMTQALRYAMASGNDKVKEEAETFLAEHPSKVDEAAFL